MTRPRPGRQSRCPTRRSRANTAESRVARAAAAASLEERCDASEPSAGRRCAYRGGVAPSRFADSKPVCEVAHGGVRRPGWFRRWCPWRGRQDSCGRQRGRRPRLHRSRPDPHGRGPAPPRTASPVIQSRPWNSSRPLRRRTLRPPPHRLTCPFNSADRKSRSAHEQRWLTRRPGRVCVDGGRTPSIR